MKAKLHFSPQRNWMNDPNGLVYYKGEYHMYFQYFPYDLVWGTMHWGHATSTDLINWKEHKIALYPSVEADKNGCFSGSAIVENDQLIITYTGVNYNDTLENDIHNPGEKGFVSRQIIIKTTDPYNLNKNTTKQILLDEITDPEIGESMHTRDPKIWKHNDDFYFCLGTKVKNDSDNFIGKILIYKSKDLNNFKLIADYSSDFVGNMWECPDYFTINDESFLIMSPEQMTNDNRNYVSNSIICKANLDYQQETFTIEENYQYLDYGLDMYAPQSFLDKDANRVLIGWLRMPKQVDGSIGMQSLPRILKVDSNNNINYSLHSNIYEGLIKVEEHDFKTNSYYISTTIKKGDTYNIGGLIIKHDGLLNVDRSNIFTTSEMIGLKQNTPQINDNCNLEIIIDINVIEIFIDDGSYVISLIVDNFTNELKINNNFELKTWE